jgi:hypothetical protein
MELGMNQNPNFDSTFRRLYNSELYADAKLHWYLNPKHRLLKKTIHAHRAVLTTRSEYFRKAFEDVPMQEGLSGEITLEEDSPQALETAIKFMYDFPLSEILPTAANLRHHLQTAVVADKYLITGLSRAVARNANLAAAAFGGAASVAARAFDGRLGNMLADDWDGSVALLKKMHHLDVAKHDHMAVDLMHSIAKVAHWHLVMAAGRGENIETSATLQIRLLREEPELTAHLARVYTRVLAMAGDLTNGYKPLRIPPELQSALFEGGNSSLELCLRSSRSRWVHCIRCIRAVGCPEPRCSSASGLQ